MITDQAESVKTRSGIILVDILGMGKGGGKSVAAKRKYRWEEWFTRGRCVLVRGIDYKCSQSCMCATVRNNASRMGLRLRVIDNGDSLDVEVVGEVRGTVTTPVAG